MPPEPAVLATPSSEGSWSRPGPWPCALWLPLSFATANYFWWPLAMPAISGDAASLAFNLVRLALMAWAGHRVVREGGAGLAAAALAGASILLVDHLVLRGGAFLILLGRGEPLDSSGHLVAFAGVLTSFAIFAPFAAVVGLAGGLLGRSRVRATARR